MLNDSVKKFMINLSNLFHFHSLFETPTLPTRVGILLKSSPFTQNERAPY